MDTRRLPYFVAVAEELHFGRAAERLHMAQQPLSVQIQSLERELGCLLLERANNRIRLTSAGEVLLREARTLLRQTDAAVELTQRTARGEVGVLRIGSCGAALHHVVPTAVRAFKEGYPEIGVSLREMGWSLQQTALERGELDLGFTYRPHDDRAFFVEEMIEDKFVVALAAEHRLARTALIEPESLVAEPFIALHLDLNACARPAMEILCHGERGPTVAYEVADRASALGLVGNGLGFTVLPALAALPFPGVVYVPLGTDRRMYMGAIWYRHAAPSVVQERFVATLRTLIAANVFPLGRRDLNVAGNAN